MYIHEYIYSRVYIHECSVGVKDNEKAESNTSHNNNSKRDMVAGGSVEAMERGQRDQQRGATDNVYVQQPAAGHLNDSMSSNDAEDRQLLSAHH